MLAILRGDFETSVIVENTTSAKPWENGPVCDSVSLVCQEEIMAATPGDPNRQNRTLWLVLVIVGLVLAVLGWYRFAS